MNRQAQAVVLLLVGGAILRASLTDLYTRYVKVGLQPFLVVAGIILIAAAVVTLWYELRPRKPHGAYAATHDGDAHEPDDGHGHVHEPRVAWFLVLPVFALLLVAPPALGSYAANRSGISLQQVSDFPALPAGDPVKISVIDYATRAVFDDGKSLKGRKIKLSGFVMIAHDGAPYLARMVLSCCAADARPVKLGMTGGVPPGAKADSWLEIVGQYTDKTTKDDVNQAVIPYIEVIEAHSIEAPSNHYDS